MINYKVYYDYFDGEKVPIWFVVDVKNSQVDWEQDIFHIKIQAPFEIYSSEDFNPYAMNVSVTMHEITVSATNNFIGINLNLLKERLNEHDVDPYDVANLVIQVADIEDVLCMVI